MAIASIVNMSESLFFIHIDNSSCYDSYAENLYLDISIFIFIRLVSHYAFLISCLYIFKVKKRTPAALDINSESESSFRVASYYDEGFSESSLRTLRSSNNFERKALNNKE